MVIGDPRNGFCGAVGTETVGRMNVSQRSGIRIRRQVFLFIFGFVLSVFTMKWTREMNGIMDRSVG